MKQIKVQYFAVFREQSGLGEESIGTVSRTAGDLYMELAAKHSFSLPPAIVRASINLEFRSLDTELRNGDTVVFIPPVAGG